MTDNPTQNNNPTAKDIAKNIGNLSKEIIKALAAMQGDKPDEQGNPPALNTNKAQQNMQSFNTIISGSISGIIKNIGSLNINTFKDEHVTGATNLGKMVKTIKGMIPAEAIDADRINTLKSIGDLCVEGGGLCSLINYLGSATVDEAAAKKVVAILGSAKGAVKKVGDIIKEANLIPELNNANNATKISDTFTSVKDRLADIQTGLGVFDANVLKYFTAGKIKDDSGNEKTDPSAAMKMATQVKIAISGSKAALSKVIAEYLSFNEIKVNGGNKSLEKLKTEAIEIHNALETNLLQEKTGILSLIFGDIEATRNLMQSFDKQVFDYFIESAGELIKPNGQAENPIEKVFKQISVDGAGNETVTDISKFYTRNVAVFGQMVNGMKLSLNAIKKVSGPITTYEALFAGKNDNPTTVAQIELWSNKVKDIHEKMGLIVGKVGDKNNVLSKIVDDITTFSEFSFDMPAVFDNPKPKDTTFGVMMSKIQTAMKSIATVRTAIDSYVGVFAQKEKKDNKSNTITQEAKTTIEVIDGWVTSVTNVGDRMDDVFGETGVVKIILQMLEDVDTSSNLWSIPESFSISGNDAKSKFQERIDGVKSAVISISKVSDIIKAVMNTHAKIHASLKNDSGSFSQSVKWLRAMITSEQNPFTTALSIVVDVDKMVENITTESQYAAILNKPKIDPKTGKVDEVKGNPWGKEIGEALTALKGIQILAQIPKEVKKTHDKLRSIDKEIDVKSLIEEIKNEATDLFEQVSDGLIGIDEVVRNSNLAKITKETSDSITNTNAALRGIQDIVQTIVDSGEMMEKISYRRLIHASIQIEFFIEMITSILKDLDGVSQQFTAQQSNIEETSKRILKALEPIKKTFINLNEIVEVIIDANNISPRKLKSRANKLRKRIVASVAMLNDLIPVIAKDVEAMTPDDKQLAKDFGHIMEPIKNLIDLMKTIMEVKIPNKFVLKYKIWILKSRIVYIAQAMDELNTEISKIRGNKIDNSALRSVQASMMAITSIIESFNNAAKICTVLLIRGKFVRPAIKLIIKQLDIFDKLTARINRMKDTHKANRKIRRMEELVRGVALLAISMILLVPILALFIIASPLLVIGIVVFALTMKLIIKLIDFMINAKVGLAIVELALVVMALIAIALLFIVLAMLAEPLLKGLPMICLMMLGILAFAAVLAVFGLLVSVMWPFMLAGLAGIGIVTIAVVCILVIALVLKVLEFINLNPTAVLDNVHVVLDTAKEVMMLAFGPETDPRGPNQETGFLDVIGGALVNIIRALAASVILILTVVSVAAILIIATLLRMLALYDVEKLKQGKANAAVTLGVAREVVDLLFGSDAPKSEESKDRGTFEALIDYVAKPLGALLKAIFAVAYLAVMVIAISMIMLLATQIRLLALFNPQELENGKTNALLTVQTAASIIAELFRADDTDRTPSERGGLLCVVGYLFGKEFEDIIRAVLSVAYLGVLLLSTFLVLLLARQISEIGKLSPGTISQGKANALLVVKTAGEIMGSIFGAGDTDTGEEGGSWLKKILKWVLPSDLYFMIDAMIKIGKLALLVMAVGAIGKLAEQLTALSKFNVNSTTAKNKAMMVINSAGSLVANLKSMSNDADVSEKDASNMYELCTSLEKIPGALVPVANNIMKLASINEESINSATANGLTVIRATRQMIEELNGFDYNDSGTRARLDIMDRISQTVGSFVKVTDSDVENSKNITENYIKFFKQIDSMDVKKLQHTDYLMRSWASISRDLKGNFEGLAQTINQHIMPMLEKVNETLQKTTQCQQEIIAELTKPVDINGGGGSTSLGAPPSTDTPPGQTTPETPGSTGRDGSYVDTVNPAHRDAGKLEHGKGKTPPPNMNRSSTIEPKKDKKYVVTFATIKEA